MTRCFIIGLVLAFTPALAFAKDISFSAPDAKARVAISTLPEDFAPDTQAAWVDIVKEAPPYLFLMPIEKCGASNCIIYGFRPSSGGWTKIYEVFGGDGFIIPGTLTENHHDIVQYESQGSGSYVVKTSRWQGDRYAHPIIAKP